MVLKLITFDITGTIVTLRQAVGLQYAQVAKLYGVTASPDSLSTNFKITFKQLLVEHPNFGESSVGWQAWWRELVSRVFHNTVSDKSLLKSQTVDKLSNHLIDLYKTEECWNLTEGAQEVLQSLSKKSISLGVVSNYDPRLETILKSLKIHNYFDFVLTSYKAKSAKPDLNIFKAVENMNAHIKKSEILHIGDNPKLDFISAKTAGWNALLISKNPKLVLEGYPNIEEEFVVKNLSEMYLYLQMKRLI